MKSVIIVSLFMFLTATLLADEPRVSTFHFDDIGQSSSDFECMNDPAFSQIFSVMSRTQSISSSLREWAVRYNASKPFNSIRLWLYDDQNVLNASNPITVKIFSGPPNDPQTTVIKNFSVYSTMQNVSIEYVVTHQIDIELPEVIDFLSGYIGFTFYNPQTNYYTTTFFSHDLGSNLEPIYSYAGGSWSTSSNSSLICLGAPPPAPIANYALYFSALLMIAFVAYRFSVRS